MSKQVSIDVETVQTALDQESSGASMVVLKMETLAAAVNDSEAPFGAAFAWNTLSRMETATCPEVVIAPPWPAATWNS